MKNTNAELNNLLSKSTIYVAVKADVENGCTKPSEDYSLSAYKYMNKVYKYKASTGSTDSLNLALGYDINNDDLISDMTIHYLKNWNTLCNNYSNLIEKYPAIDDEIKVIMEFNKIVSATYINHERDLNRKCKISEQTTVTQKDKKTGELVELIKRVYKEFKPTINPLSFDADQTNSESDDEMATLYDCTPTSNATPEDLTVSNEMIAMIAGALINKPRLLLAFFSKFAGESAQDILFSSKRKMSWTDIYERSLESFCKVYTCWSIKSLFSGLYSEDALTYKGTSNDMYKVLTTERSQATKSVVEYVLKNNLYTPSKHTHHK